MEDHAESVLQSTGRVSEFASVNAELLRQLGDLILARFGPAPLTTHRVVGIAGAGCVGKSTFADALADILRRDHSYDCASVDLDGYLIEKSQRESSQPIISGYHPRAFEVDRAAEDIARWRTAGRPFHLWIYDKVTSLRLPGKPVEASDLLIIEGACAFYEPLRDLGDLKIFLWASKQLQYANRYHREKEELKRPDAEIQEKFAHLYPDYERYILPTLSLADVVLEVEDGYRLKNPTFSIVQYQGSG